MRKNIGLYKGKVKGGGAWLCGYLSRRTICTDNRAYLGYAIQPEPQGTTEACRYVWYEVDESTICEYTGLTDKNGKKIFEGDIIKTDEYGKTAGQKWVRGFDVFVVTYTPGRFLLENGWRLFNLTDTSNNSVQYYEVIGNIFDNPEMLKTEGQNA